MNNRKTKELVLGSIFIATGLLLPMLFHSVSGGGSIFLPMHIPVLLSGFFVSWPIALGVGILTPVLSSVMTGMPPIFPVLPFMVIELATYALSASLLYRKLDENIYVSLVISMILGRIMAGVTVWFLVKLFTVELPGPILFIQGAIIKGIPGIIIQLILIPAIVKAGEKFIESSSTDLRV